ncbi:BEL1-like homeodomain protein 2 [Primulina tabacum]|uniref:BEL1-like homeodomain protein 2 n=1 Tax=Primulina tabacum TaxID=48773 RepID=UPI003F596915
MSQDYHQGVFSFFNGFERSSVPQQDKLRIQEFGHCMEDEGSGGIPAYETGGMLSEMFKYFPPGETTTATELMENQTSGSYGDTRPSLAGVDTTGDWFLNRQEVVVGGGLVSPLVDSKNQISSINADPTAVMQLFLMNPQQQRSPSSSPSDPPTVSASSTLHMLLPDPSSNPPTLLGFHNAAAGGAFGQMTWEQDSRNGINLNHNTSGVLEGRGLSLSLSSSLQHLEASKGDNLRMQAGNGDVILVGHTGVSAPPHYQLKNPDAGCGLYHFHCEVDHTRQMQVGPFGAFHILKNSKYTRSAQALLEEFCSVGFGHLKKNKRTKQNNNANPISPDQHAGATSDGGGGNSSSKPKEPPPPSASDRLEHQRRKVKLLSMLDEVDSKYSHYCEQMQMVMNSFDTVMGSGAAAPYTSLAQKAMSKHFRGLKEAISAQLKLSREILGEKDAAGTSGLTKGETPRLRILEQSLRQHRGIHQMGLMEQEAWRPQRGLPDRSVNVLRAWLFEHFLNPYPSDADKHLLARQTGLSRNQVSNWFINARVRLWKPMVEEMYQKESKEDSEEQEQDQSSNTPVCNDILKTPTPHADSFSSSAAGMTPPLPSATNLASISLAEISLPEVNISARTCHHASYVCSADNYGTINHPLNGGIGSTLTRLGTSAGDVVSLTLGLRHTGNLPEKRQFRLENLGDIVN